MILLLGCVLLCAAVSFGQTTDKKEQRKNLTVREWKTPVKGSRHLDHVTKYDAKGRKVEEVEYSQSGSLKARCTYEYDEHDRVSREVIYDENNKASRVRKFEYNADGTRKRQLTYSAKGSLISVKEFEYIRK